MLGSSSIWSGGITVVLFIDGDFYKDNCLNFNGITDLTHSITPTMVSSRKTI